MSRTDAAAAGGLLPSVCGRLGALVLLAVPFAVQVELERGSRSVVAANLPLLDPILWTGAALIALSVAFALVRRRPRAPLDLPLDLLLLPAVACLSMLVAGPDVGSAPDLVQLVDLFVIWPALLWFCSRTGAGRGLVRHGPALVLVAFAGAACWQIREGFPYYLVRSCFRDRQSYLTACVLLAPLAWAALSSSPSAAVRVASHGLLLVVATTLGSVGAAVLLAGQVAVAAWLAGSGWLLRAVPALAALGGGLFLAGVDAAWLDRSAPRVDLTSRRTDVLEANAAFMPPLPQWNGGTAGDRVFAGVNVATWTEAPRIDPEERAARESIESPSVPTEYLAECFATLGIVGEKPVLGRGPGRFTEAVGQGFGSLQRTGTNFPSTHNGYLMTAVSFGLVGVGAFLLHARRSIGRAVRAARARPKGVDRALCAGAAGGLLGGAVWMLFFPVPFQPLGAYWVLLVAVPAFAASDDPEGEAAP